ncbi:hypothetical protein [Endozoicomonas sp. SESOKO1]|uniref:hypothetical protein n=1 Tax=Endozoicomonas sp. SESOKO1 TaxID=2828742 RepID=UPI0021480AEB|nr:hypothetical protein [Endozoicomonas sp. SESOKO1]
MDIRLPNGTVLQGVPDGTSKQDIMRKAISSGLASEEDFQQNQQPSTQDTEVDRANASVVQSRNNLLNSYQQLIRTQEDAAINNKIRQKQVQSGIRDKAPNNTDSLTWREISRIANSTGSETLDDALTGFNEGISLGFSDELQGIGTALGSIFTDESLSNAYVRGRDEARAEQYAATERSPIAATAGNVAGTLVPAAGVTGAVSKVANTLNLGTKATRGLQIAGATAEGALAGVGTSESDTGTGLAVDTATGAVLGGIFGTVGEALDIGIGGVRNLLHKPNGKELIQEVLLDAKPADISNADYAAQLKNQISGLGDQATLADLEQLTDITEQIGRLTAPDTATVNTLNNRVTATENAVKDTLSSPMQAGDRLLGETIVDSDLVPDTKVLDPEKFTNRLRKEANQRAKPFYDVANTSTPRSTQTQRQEIKRLRNSTPAFNRYWNQARTSVLNGKVHRDSPVYTLEKGKQQIDSDIAKELATDAPNRSKVRELEEVRDMFADLSEQYSPDVRAGDIASVEVLDRIGLSPNDMVNPITTARRLGQEPRQIASNINRGIAATEAGIDSGRRIRNEAQSLADESLQLDDPVRSQVLGDYADRVYGSDGGITPDRDRLIRSLSAQDPRTTANQQGIGGGTVLRNRVEQRPRPQSGRLLTDAEEANLERIAEGVATPSDHSPLTRLLDADEIANRTANLANLTPRGLVGNLRNNFRQLAQDGASMAAIYTAITNPNAVMFGLVSNRLGQAQAGRLTNKKLAREAQKDLFRLGLNADEVDNLLQGNFDAVPKYKVVEFSRKLADELNITAEGITDTIRTGSIASSNISSNTNEDRARQNYTHEPFTVEDF